MITLYELLALIPDDQNIYIDHVDADENGCVFEHLYEGRKDKLYDSNFSEFGDTYLKKNVFSIEADETIDILLDDWPNITGWPFIKRNEVNDVTDAWNALRGGDPK